MKRIAIILLLTANAFGGFSQVVSQGEGFLNVAFGAGNFIRPSGFTTKVVPIMVQYEKMLSSEFSFGGFLGYSSSEFRDARWLTNAYWPYRTAFYEYKWTTNHVFLGIKGAYHFHKYMNLPDNLDLYVGASLGYNITALKVEQLRGEADLHPILDPEPSSKAMLGIFIGARYFLTDNLAVLGEFGYSSALLNLGLSFGLK